MILHKYLPPEEMKKFLNDGLKNVHAKKVESCLNPALCARFEHAWKAMREERKYGIFKCRAAVADLVQGHENPPSCCVVRLLGQCSEWDASSSPRPLTHSHGTSEASLEGITSTGFLLSKLSAGSGDNGEWCSWRARVATRTLKRTPSGWVWARCAETRF